MTWQPSKPSSSARCLSVGFTVRIAADEVELMSRLLRDLPHGSEFRIHENIGLTIKRLPLGQEALDSCERLRIVQQWTMCLAMNPLPDGFGGSPKAHHEGVGFQAIEVRSVGGQSAAGRDDDAPALLKAGHHVALVLAELSLAFEPKYFADAPSAVGLD